jgi:8-oxo-dGTP pyrophosphatase MutT (NUDIX family)
MRTNVVGGIRIVAVLPDGQQLDVGRLPHGQHPDTLLASKGWRVESPCAARLLTDGALELSYDVSQLSGIPSLERADVQRDSGVAPGDLAEPYQRVAAYAIVTSERGLLLTQFSGRTNKPDHWGLPGGGLDEGEGPADGVHREVWEETGQRIELGALVQVQSQHWIGHSPSGELEDFHAVRIVYRATCAEPTEPVIHDVGGTTSDARWVPVDELGDYSLTSSWAHLHELVGAPQ